MFFCIPKHSSACDQLPCYWWGTHKDFHNDLSFHCYHYQFFFARQTMDGHKKNTFEAKTQKTWKSKMITSKEFTKKIARGHLSGDLIGKNGCKIEVFFYTFFSISWVRISRRVVVFFFLRAGFVPGILMRDSVVPCCCRSVQFVRLGFKNNTTPIQSSSLLRKHGLSLRPFSGILAYIVISSGSIIQ